MADTQATFNPRTASDWAVYFIDQNGTEREMGSIVEQLSIYESIYNNAMFGVLKIKDATGFVEGHGIVGSGKEIIKFEITTPSAEVETTTNIEKEFVIAGISNGVKEEKYFVYDLTIVSPNIIKNNNTLISRSFMSMTSSDIVNYVAADIMEFGVEFEWEQMKTVEDSKHTKDIVVPNWKPFELMNFLCRNSVSIDNYSNYVFFENNEGYHFVTIDKLKEAEPSRKLHLKMNTKTSQLEEGGGGKVMSDGSTISEYMEINRYDLNKGVLDGLYGGKLLTHNLLTKKLTKYELTYDGMADMVMAEGIGQGGPNLYEVNTDAHRGFMSDNGIYQIHDKGDKPHYLVRDLKSAEMRNTIVKFDIAGDSNIFAGDVVTLVIPTNLQYENEPEDQYMTGKWLVTAIHHKINNFEYVMTMECMKDGFYSDPAITIPARG